VIELRLHCHQSRRLAFGRVNEIRDEQFETRDALLELD
jgi:hypothetical protein